MLIYWCLFAVFGLGALLNQYRAAGGGRALFFLVAAVPTALMIGLRWKIGPDWSSYQEIFDYTKLFSFSQAITHADPGYFTLMWLLDWFGEPFWTINLVCGAVFSTGLWAFSRRQPNPWLSFLVAFPYLVIVIAMSGNRQSLALGFMFFALNAYKNDRINLFVLLMIVAALFHGSILFLLPICLLSYTKNKLHTAVLLLAAAIIGVYSFTHTFDTYFGRYSSTTIQSSGTVYRLAMNSLAAVIFLRFKSRFDLDPHEKTLWRNISLFTLLLWLAILVVPSSTAVDRFLLYLFPLQFLVLSRLPTAFATERQMAGQLTVAVIGYAALVQVVFLQLGTFASYYIPYRTVFQR